MAIATRRRTRIVLAVLALLLALSLWDGDRLRWMHSWNEQIASGKLEPASSTMPPEARFALAFNAAINGDDQGALNGYREVQTTPRLAGAARYNSANILVRQAIVLQGSPAPGQAIPLLELAKENYREVLRADPGNWDARYNLERAQRLLPDPDDGEPVSSETPRAAERAATTMRGFSPGLP
jgi:mxaK protein